MLARITIYWHLEGSGEQAFWNGTRLREGIARLIQREFIMAVKLCFPMRRVSPQTLDPMWSVAKLRACVGGSRPSARPSSSTGFFDSKQKALAWAKAHPHFMTVRILTPGSKEVRQACSFKRSKVVAHGHC